MDLPCYTQFNRSRLGSRLLTASNYWDHPPRSPLAKKFTCLPRPKSKLKSSNRRPVFFCGRTLKTTTYWFLCKSMLSRKQHVSKQEVIQATICNILKCEGLRARDKSWQIQTNLSCRFCVCVIQNWICF
jgi:hypothetical protein